MFKSNGRILGLDLGTKTLGAKMQSEQMVHTALGADLIMDGSKK